MNLCIDVGNTTIKIGLFEAHVLKWNMSLSTDNKKTDDEYAQILNRAMDKEYLTQVERICYSSVVPSVNIAFISALKMVFHKEVTVIHHQHFPLPLSVKYPSEVGGDLLADLLAAKMKFGYPTLVVDLGTASKVLLVDKNGEFSTCVIMPGLFTSAKSLTSGAALLNEINIENPVPINESSCTKEALTAGLVYGHTSMIEGIINRYEKALGYSCRKVLTGGVGKLLKNYLSECIYEPNLCLEGLDLYLGMEEKR